MFAVMRSPAFRAASTLAIAAGSFGQFSLADAFIW